MSTPYRTHKEIGDSCIQFVDKLCKVGITSLSSRELQVRVIGLILEIRKDLKTCSQFEISKELIIPESKLKKILYEIELKKHNDSLEIIEQSIHSFEINSNYVILDITSEYARNLIKDKLRFLNHFSDSSFNKDLVKISYAAFIDLVKNLLPKGKKKDNFSEKIKMYNKLKRDQNFENAVKGFICKIPGGDLAIKATELVSETIDQVDGYLKDLVDT